MKDEQPWEPDANYYDGDAAPMPSVEALAADGLTHAELEELQREQIEGRS